LPLWSCLLLADFVAKLGGRRLARNNRIGGKQFLNRCCALIAVLESMLLARALKIVLQHYRHICDLWRHLIEGCLRQLSGRVATAARGPGLTPLYGPAVRRKRFSSIWRICGLASMYPASDWSELCSGPPWISARVRSHYRTGLSGPNGSPVFARAGKTDPPSRLILSQTSAGNRCWGYVMITPHLAQFLCSCRRPAVPSSRPTFGSPSTARHSSRSGCHLIRPGVFELALLAKNGPGDTGKLVGERDCQHVVV